MQFVKNILVNVLGVFTFSFYYFFYDSFIPKIILVSHFLPLICITYLLKVFRFDTGILRDSCAVLLLKTLSRLPESVAFLCLILFFTWVLCIFIILHKGCHILYVFSLNSMVCSHIIGVNLSSDQVTYDLMVDADLCNSFLMLLRIKKF